MKAKRRKRSQQVRDRLENFGPHQKVLELFDLFWADSEILGRDYRWRELVKQMVRSIGSISANIEEGYSRGYGKEYAYFLCVARVSARESKGWYHKSRHLLSLELIEERMALLDEIISMLVASITSLEKRHR